MSHWFEPVDRPVASEISTIYEQNLGQWADAGKLVLTIDFTTVVENIQTAYESGRERGYIPLTARSLALDTLSIPAGYEPD